MAEMLSRLGMSEYTTGFFAEGFDTWEAIMDIADADLAFLAVSQIHRARLRKEILTARGQLTVTSIRGTNARISSPSPKRTTRIYRRHPKADTCGPKHPLSAYVLFANDVRKKLGDTQLSFSQISQRTGASWQLIGNLEPSEWKIQAARTKGIYLQDLEKYKKTSEYRDYQQYLVNFKLQRKSSTRLHQGPNLWSLPSRSSNASFEAHPMPKVSVNAQSSPQTSPLSSKPAASQKLINPGPGYLQTLDHRETDTNQCGDHLAFDTPYEDFNTPSRLLAPRDGSDNGPLLPLYLPPDIGRLQASHSDNQPSFHAMQANGVRCDAGVKEKQLNKPITAAVRSEVSSTSQVQQPRGVLCPSYSPSGDLIYDRTYPTTTSGRGESVNGVGRGYDYSRHRVGYFETVLQSRESDVAGA